MIEIDGSLGEGGGQILRTALSLSVITRQPFSLVNIRANRPQPGLKPQHINAIHAAAAISRADYTEVRPGARELQFSPNELVGDRYRFDIGTAGSIGLVLQTIVLPLSFADQPSSVIITGGTHVPWSPCYHYLDWHWRPYLESVGFVLNLEMKRAGFYPPGGGEVVASIRPHDTLVAKSLLERGKLELVRGLSGIAKLPRSIAERQRDQALARLADIERPVAIAIEQVDAISPGTYLVLLAQFESSQYCYTALGARGKRAEAVADEAVDQFRHFLNTDGAVDRYLADQLLLPLALAPGTSRLRTAVVSNHLFTNAAIIQRFLDVTISIAGELDSPGTVVIQHNGRT